jgi:hypothetical protein
MTHREQSHEATLRELARLLPDTAILRVESGESIVG